MPSTITHDYHFKDVYDSCSNSFQKYYPKDFYYQHSIFGQGHDALFFSDFWKLYEFNKKRNQAIYLQDHKFQDFCLEFINLIKIYNLKESKNLKLLLYGYIMHHILDSFTHPYIIYESEVNGMHELIESFIDKYMIEQREEKDSNKYKFHKMIAPPPKLKNIELELINDAFFYTYGFENFGKTYVNALNQVNLFLRLFRYDSTGIKNLGYRLIDKTNILPITFSFLSYHHDYSGFDQFLNEEHRLWFNPCNPNLSSTDSFFELYNSATKEVAKIICELEMAINDNATDIEIKSIIPNTSAIHGLTCDQELPFKILKRTNRGNLKA